MTKKIIDHLKEDVKGFKKEIKEDEDLIQQLKKPKGLPKSKKRKKSK